MFTKCISALTAVLVLATAASADLMFYGSGDRAAFDAAATIGITETFDLVTPKDAPLSSFTSQGVTYAGVGNSNVWVTSYPYPNFGVAVPDPTVLTATGNEDFMLNMAFATPITAVGFDTYLNRYGPVTVQIEDAEGWTTTLLDHDPTTVGFFGVTSTSPISTIRWTAIGGEVINTGIDNVQLGVVAVPAPGAMVLAMFGLSLVGAKFRKRA